MNVLILSPQPVAYSSCAGYRAAGQYHSSLLFADAPRSRYVVLPLITQFNIPPASAIRLQIYTASPNRTSITLDSCLRASIKTPLKVFNI